MKIDKIAMVAGILGIAGFVYYFYKKKKEQKAVEDAKKSALASNTTTPTVATPGIAPTSVTGSPSSITDKQELSTGVMQTM
jgi:LPXTG-motif cell wall-anchored protein